MKKKYLVLFAIVIIISATLFLPLRHKVVAYSQNIDLLQIIINLESRISYVEQLLNISTDETENCDLMDNTYCVGNDKIVRDYYCQMGFGSDTDCEKNYCSYSEEVTICGHGCENGECNPCASMWLCKDNNTNGYQNSDCSWTNLTACEYGCSDGKCNEPPPKGIIMFQMDDTQCWWLEEESEQVVLLHAQKGIDLVVGVVPKYIDSPYCTLGEKLVRWNNDYPDLIEIADHTYDHERRDQNIACYGYSQQKIIAERGLKLFQKIGLNPTTYIPAGPWGCDWTENTMKALKSLGFNTFLDGGVLKEWWTPVTVPDFNVITDGVYLCKNDGDSSCYSFKTYNSLMERVDQQIEERGFAVIIFHQQDFAGGRNMDTYSDYLDKIKGSEKYTFMTVQEYVRAE